MLQPFLKQCPLPTETELPPEVTTGGRPAAETALPPEESSLSKRPCEGSPGQRPKIKRRNLALYASRDVDSD